MTDPVNPATVPSPTDFVPRGAERKVVFLESAAIGGAPVAYVIVLATVAAVLSFVPFSIALAAGSSFPMSQGVFPLLGWLLGPLAGAVASGIGALVGVFLAPHTAGIPWITVSGAALASFFAGAMVTRGRHRLWAVLSALVLATWGGYFWLACLQHGVALRAFFLGYSVHLSAALLLLLPPARRAVGCLLVSPDMRRVAVGLFLGTWSAAGNMMFVMSAITYGLITWPEEVFYFFIGVIPIEHTVRCAVGTVIGTGVIAGLRAMSLVKPPEARF